ncbi:MAG: hypothetical protein KF880_08035 [Ferruginibacter sp.]|nr:hypothetical protein [Ferruginibacter sp.]
MVQKPAFEVGFFMALMETQNMFSGYFCKNPGFQFVPFEPSAMREGKGGWVILNNVVLSGHLLHVLYVEMLGIFHLLPVSIYER